MVITRVSPLSCAKVCGMLYAIMGLILGAFVSLFMVTIGSVMPTARPMNGVANILFGAGAIVVLPIFYGVIGAVMSAISALVYNIVAHMVGGIEMDVQGAERPAAIG